MAAYALVDGDCDEHRLEKQNLERHGENVVEPTSHGSFICFHGCVIATVSSLLSYPLSSFNKNNGSVGFRNSKKHEC